MRTKWSDPHALMACVIECLSGSDAWGGETWDRILVHTGPYRSGETLAVAHCCNTGVLRVETGSKYVSGAEDGYLARRNGCERIVQRIHVTWRTCWSTQTSAGKTRKPAEIARQAFDWEQSGWEAVRALARCDSLLRFVSLDPSDPAACVGWELIVEGELELCAT